jgi:glycosyl transferase family 25
MGIDFEFLDAIDGRMGHIGLLNEVDTQRFVIETGRQVTPGEIGCYASHLAVWRMAETANEAIVILEDDAVLSEDFREALTISASLIQQCGFIRLQNEHRGRSRPVLQISDPFELRLYSRVPHSASGYVIAPRVARALACAAATMTAPIDVFMKKFWEHKQLMFGLTPYAVDVGIDAAQSTIGARRKAAKNIHQRIERQAYKLQCFGRRILESHRQSTALRNPNVRPHSWGGRPPSSVRDR